MALTSCLLMLIMHDYTFIRLSPMRTCRAMAWLTSSTVVLAAMSGRSAARPPAPRVSQVFPPPWKTSCPPAKFMLAAGAYSWQP